MTTRVVAFSDSALRDRLARLSIEKILAFSASCTEVLIPASTGAGSKLYPVFAQAELQLCASILGQFEQP